MAVPDCRACFDHYRFPSTLADWLQASFEDRNKPTAAQIFDFNTLNARYYRNGVGDALVGCSLPEELPIHFKPEELLEAGYAQWQSLQHAPSSVYVDTHCSTFFNHTLELILRDLRFLGLIQFDIIEISETKGLEFFVHLRKCDIPHQGGRPFINVVARSSAQSVRTWDGLAFQLGASWTSKSLKPRVSTSELVRSSRRVSRNVSACCAG
ncbi:MAG: hypothetical protein HC834_01970 [Rhodospirillales bacterium]|nr:hypothetical protein [Rhodospirillales bacterium]